MNKENALVKLQDGVDKDTPNINESKGLKIRQIDLISISSNPDQPRRKFSDESIAELAKSIECHGWDRQFVGV